MRASNNDSLWLIGFAILIWWLATQGGASPFVPPNPAPFPSDGLRVLVLEETEERSRLPVKQLTALTSAKCRDYMDAKAMKGPDGSPEWQVWDDDLPTDKMQPIWKEAVDVAKAKSNGARPWLIISNGNGGYSGPLPATEDEFLAELQKWGGA
jgi:hypothetical protein